MSVREALRADRIAAASALPPRLLNFFKKYPPQTAFSSSSQQQNDVSVAGNTSSADANANVPLSLTEESSTTTPTILHESPNPFLPFKHPISQHWHPPTFSLRRQAEIIKLAQQHGCVSLLPYSPKLPSEVAKKRVEQGLRVKGTGIGQKVKGKLWERTLKGRLEVRKKAMEGMDELVKNWKQRGHGRGWKKWPK